MQPEEERAEERFLDGPDPRAWPGRREIWGLVEDLAAIDQVNGALKGDRHAMDGMSEAYEEALRLLAVFRANRCEQLSLTLLSVYGVEVPASAGASPFDGAGKPRAFGADSPPVQTLQAPRPLRRPLPRKVQEGATVSTTTVWEPGLTCDAEACGGEFGIGDEIIYWYGQKLHPACASAAAASRRQASGEDGDVMDAARAILSSGVRVVLTRRQLRDLVALAVKAGIQPVRKPDAGQRKEWYGRMSGWSTARVRAGLPAPEVAGMWLDFLEVGRMPPLRSRDLEVMVNAIVVSLTA